MFLRVFSLLSLVVFLASCSTSQTVRVPAPLVEKSSPYELKRLWQLTMNLYDYSDSEGLYIAQMPNQLYMAEPSGLLTAVHKGLQPTWSDQVAWQRQFDAPILSGPTLYKQSLVIGTAKGSLLQVSQQDGAIIWQTELSSEVLSRPVIYKGNIYVRTVDGKLVSVQAATGKLNWTVEHTLPNLSLRGIAPVTVVDDVIYVGWESGFVEALSTRSGERLWRTQVAYPSGRTDLERMVDIQSQLIMKHGRLFVLGYHGKLVSLNPKTGNLFWSKKVSGFRDFITDDNNVYLMDEDDLLYAYDVMNGTLIWKTAAYKYRQLADLTFYNEQQILLADRQGYLHWIDKLDGALVARAKHSNDLGKGDDIARVTVNQNQLYLQDTDGYLTAYDVIPSAWYEFNQPTDPLKIMPQIAAEQLLKTEKVQ